MPQYLIFFYKASFGEIFAGLPFIVEILNKKPNIKALFIYSNDEQINNIPLSYKKIIEKYFKLVKITNKNFLLFFFKHIFTKNLIITCDNGYELKSSLLSFYSLKSRILFFHHAYAIQSSNKINNNTNNKIYKKLFDGYHHESLFCAHNKNEIEYRKSQYFTDENIILAGNIGYTSEWINKISTTELDQFIKEKKQKFDKIIFIPTRDTHEIYLSEKNSLYLLNSIEEIIQKFKNYLFLIKLHPRQKDIIEFENITKKNKNCFIINFDTVSISKKSDLVISYWSSAITDALSANVPVVEFHKHEIYHQDLIEKNSIFISLYHYNNLCPFYKKKEEIVELLLKPEKWDRIKDTQQESFKKIFPNNYLNFVDEILIRFQKTPFKYKYIFYFFIFPIKIGYHLICNNKKL